MKAAAMDSLDVFRSSLPSSVGEWKASDVEDRFFDPETIFDYIDGAGEVYRAYNMKKCLARRYVDDKGSAIILDVFDMGSPADAFGVFTHDREGDPIPVGQEGLYRAGWLRFWKGRFFISIFDEAQSAASMETAKRLAEKVSEPIREPGLRPGLVSRLPSSGLQPNSVRYLHHPVILNTHYYLSDENILHLEPLVEAVIAEYRREGRGAVLMMVSYPSEEKSKEAYRSVLTHYLPDAKEGVSMLENGKWSAVGSRGRAVAFVPEADTVELSKNLLNEALDTAAR